MNYFSYFMQPKRAFMRYVGFKIAPLMIGADFRTPHAGQDILML